MADKPLESPTPNSLDIYLYRESRNESSSTMECYIGDSLAGDFSGKYVYAILYKAFGSPSFTTIYSWQGGVAQQEDSFINKKQWFYTHFHGSSDSGQYYVNITDTEDIGISYSSSTISFPRFSGYGKRQTRYSGNASLKSQRKTRKQIPGF
jgi:hypothetical protein